METDAFNAFDAVLDAFASGVELKRSKTAVEKVLSHSTKTGEQGAGLWTDHVVEFENSRRTPSRFRRIFRIPEGAMIPSQMTEEWTFDGNTTSRVLVMDYPKTGPMDLFALGVPKDAKVVDTTSGEELKALLTEYGKEQRSPFDSYSALVLSTVQDWKSLNHAYRVRSNETGRSGEINDLEQLMKFQMERYDANKRIVPEDVDGLTWWKSETDKLAFESYGNHEMYSIAQTFCPDRICYPLLGVPRKDWKVTLNPRSSIGPSDTSMVTVIDINTNEIVSRYWLDPARKLICVRWEMQDKTTGWIDTTIIDSAEKSPSGCWYATQVRRGQVERSGDDLKTEIGVAPMATVLFRHFVTFEGTASATP